jgi:hypothetical protein
VAGRKQMVGTEATIDGKVRLEWEVTEKVEEIKK